ncbi:MAG: MBL fold metallo-hydrolase [bacterium]|nr:MBL fold metallo-hydrolase [bacterium]
MSAADGKPKRKWLAWDDFPRGFTPFFLDPTGADLQVKEMSPGVYALLSTIPNVDNTGFVVGEKGVLVVDAHINLAMAQIIQKRIREVTDKPLLYLVNSNYHGDHTFGNCAFPKEIAVIQHRKTAELVPYMDEEKKFLFPCVGEKPEVFEGVELRLPDLVFDDYMRIDLGGRIVELHHFGPANTPGDTITYVPEARVAWTGNMTGGNLVIPLESDAPTYLNSISRMAQALELDHLIPAHNQISSPNLLGGYMQYLGEVVNAVRHALSDGLSLAEAMDRISLDMGAPYAPAPDHPRLAFFRDLHAYNVQKTYQTLQGK